VVERGRIKLVMNVYLPLHTISAFAMQHSFGISVPLAK
jgi:hypothetical protein